MRDAFGDDVGFFQAVYARDCKEIGRPWRDEQTDEQLEPCNPPIISKAMVSMRWWTSCGRRLEKARIRFISDEFLRKIRGHAPAKPRRELWQKLLKGERRFQLPLAAQSGDRANLVQKC